MSRSFSTTSRYSPVNHIRIGPFGVCTSMHTRRVPPTRTSIFATGIVAPSGPYQALKCSGSVHICQTTAACSLAIIGPASALWLTRASLHSVRSVVSPRFGVVLERRGGRGGLAHEGVSEFSDTALVVGVGGDLWLLLLAF